MNLHFLSEPQLFPDYLIDNWPVVGAKLAGAGVSPTPVTLGKPITNVVRLVVAPQIESPAAAPVVMSSHVGPAGPAMLY